MATQYAHPQVVEAPYDGPEHSDGSDNEAEMQLPYAAVPEPAPDAMYAGPPGIPAPVPVAMRNLSVYVAGANSNGQLGMYRTSRRNKSDVHAPGTIPGSVFLAVACGDSCSAGISVTGELYTWGQGGQFQLGHGSRYDHYYPRRVDELAGVRLRLIAAGKRHMVAVSEANEVFTWGDGTGGILGHRRKVSDYLAWYRKRPSRLATLPHDIGHIVQVVCGQNHTMLLTADGVVYVWGRGQFHVLGTGLTKCEEIPRRLLGVGRVVHMAAGRHHSICVDDGGNVFTWGSNKYGQLGHPPTVLMASVPMAVEGLLGKRIVQVSAGDDFTLALADDGRIYSFGRNSDGRLGNVDKKLFRSRKTYVPTALEGFGPGETEHRAVKIGCGRGFGAVLTATNDMFAFGRNARGQLGMPERKGKAAWEPSWLRLLHGVCLDFSAGGEHLAVICDMSLRVSSTAASQLGTDPAAPLDDNPQMQLQARPDPPAAAAAPSIVGAPEDFVAGAPVHQGDAGIYAGPSYAEYKADDDDEPLKKGDGVPTKTVD